MSSARGSQVLLSEAEPLATDVLKRTWCQSLNGSFSDKLRVQPFNQSILPDPTNPCARVEYDVQAIRKMAGSSVVPFEAALPDPTRRSESIPERMPALPTVVARYSRLRPEGTPSRCLS